MYDSWGKKYHEAKFGYTNRTRKELIERAVKAEWNEVLNMLRGDYYLEQKITESQDTLLHLAVYNNNEDIVEQLVSLIPPKITFAATALIRANNQGNTALHLAASVGSVRMCECIARKGSQLVGITNKEGETPLFLAALHGHKDAFLSLHSICGPKEGYNYCTRTDGDNILHSAISEEYYDLSFTIIQLYGDLVNRVNGNGMTPLNLLASKPSAFKSGTDLGWFENIIYDSFTITDARKVVREADEENPDRSEVIHGGHPSPNGALWHQPLQFVELLNKAVKFLFAFTITKARKEVRKADEENPERPHVIHGGHPSPNGPQWRQPLPTNHTTCFKAVQFLFGSSQIAKKIWMKKKRHTWATLIMNELLENGSTYRFSEGESWRHEFYPVIPEHAKSPDNTMPYEITEDNKVLYRFPGSPEFPIDELPTQTFAISYDGETDKTVPRETAMLTAAKNGITEMVEKILERFPVAMYDVDSNKKNIVLLTVEHKQVHVYELLLLLKKKNIIKDSVFCEVDNEGNGALHLASKLADSNPWPVPGAASQMQWEIKWYEFIKKSVPRRFLLLHNKNGKNAVEIFTEEHKALVENGGQWLTNTTNACSVVAGLFVTTAFGTSTTVPGGVKEETGAPFLEQQPAFNVFAISSFISFYSSLIAVVMFLAVLTSGYRESNFRYSLPIKLFLGLTAFYLSIASTLISFSTGHFFILRDRLKSAAFPVYLGICLLVTFFAIAQFPVYIHLAWATFKKLPQRNYRLIPPLFFFF